MERDEKRKKFHDALLKIYLPSSSPPPKPEPEQQIQSKEKESLVLEADLEGGSVDDVERVSSPSSDRTSDSGSGKRKSRAQRKRIRKRKLKEAESSASRRKIIGPLLPFDSQVSGDQEMPSSKDNKS
ncbi:hypothetical protein J5N97_024612 [Dioscorea zingiberensis]|uniref:Uncharacterized protein n=1 Tax=Dioscorea zingiberensis TaxID=325984 RepID=A0A9D5H939_9LILI|nr:hypothetical protein J5N97_024612 [Dioscorea zingiberensis]